MRGTITIEGAGLTREMKCEFTRKTDQREGGGRGSRRHLLLSVCPSPFLSFLSFSSFSSLDWVTRAQPHVDTPACTRRYYTSPPSFFFNHLTSGPFHGRIDLTSMIFSVCECFERFAKIFLHAQTFTFFQNFTMRKQ